MLLLGDLNKARNLLGALFSKGKGVCYSTIGDAVTIGGISRILF